MLRTLTLTLFQWERGSNPVAMLRTLTRPLPKEEERTTDKSGPSHLSPLSEVEGAAVVTSRFAFTYHDLLFTIDRLMKRCPQCHRRETDDALAFCRADGTALISDSSSIDQEAGTVKLGSGSVANETATGILPQNDRRKHKSRDCADDCASSAARASADEKASQVRARKGSDSSGRIARDRHGCRRLSLG